MAISPIGGMMKALNEPNKYQYAGLCRERASVIALDLTKRAAATGQIALLTKHLNLLAPIISRP